ncbi:MerR family transcriptional regulator [Actinomadura algeriensis]|uniref:DNA-binding transcriptional MerR regulator n=1 Tax=Actinomadura algeriensis TaxID=1679523 RepID=A0ABR9JMF6_9ACTN|nr:MerR family transcriptional regulator [Actinomadura algeriensis]MBE1531603.1 DNA-binding transcriptional MerR regulator [Actinomadura algeriensis]
MRIGELAELVGVSTRTVRHYHRQGLLPEPERLANGYREYRMRDAVLLARVRRLVELGMSLDEVRDVLADDRGRDLREVLRELDDDLARQEAAIRARRARLALLLEDGEPNLDSAVSPEMADVLRGITGGGSKFAELDRGMLALADTAAGPEGREWMLGVLRPLAEPEMVARVRDLYVRLDELADADVDDPRIAGVAADLVAFLPAEMLRAFAEQEDAGPWRDGMTPAQVEVFRRVRGC